MLYQLSYAPRLPAQCRRGPGGATLGCVSQRRALGVLFLVLTLGLAGIAVAAFRSEVWPIAFAAAVLSGWLATMALRGLTR